MAPKQPRLVLDEIDRLTQIAEDWTERLEIERQKSERLAAEVEAVRAQHAETMNELMLALTVAMDALKSASPRNESGALKIAAAKRTAAALIKGAA